MLYKIIGALVLWGIGGFIVGAALAFVFERLWRLIPGATRRRIKNVGTWLQVFAFRRRWRMPIEGARALMQVYQKDRCLDQWERNIIAFMLRHNRRVGWREPND